MGYTTKDLSAWGLPAGKHYPAALAAANAAPDAESARLAAFDALPKPADRIGLQAAAPFKTFLTPETPEEWVNLGNVERDMRFLMTCPTVISGAIMPDACPAGVIPVGGVVETSNAIHPGFHSADICCSVGMTVFANDVDPAALLDAAHAATHFGGGGRARGKQHTPPHRVMQDFANNPFLSRLTAEAQEHFATQGDGNHFLMVGRLASDGRVALVTHHGSRKPGAMLYKAGMAAAQKHTRAVAHVDDRLAWIDADSDDGRAYWNALEVIAAWTEASHREIHGLAHDKPGDWMWNAHNTIFRRGGRYLHAKGATPAWADPAFSPRRLIPLNMRDGVLIVEGMDAEGALGFAPHGAGRNVSRGAHMRTTGAENGPAELAALREAGLDVRFWFDAPDMSELPSAYKRPDQVIADMEAAGMARIVDRVIPTGSIMAGNWVRREPAAD